MKKHLLKSLSLLALSLFLLSGTAKADMPIEKPNDKVSEATPLQAPQMQTLKQDALKEQIKSLTFREKTKLFRKIRKETKIARKNGVKETPKVLLYILAVFLPPIAVGIHTDWSISTLWNLLWTICFWIPGIIHAFYIILG